MKKVVLGTGLIICGVLGILTSIIEETILFANHVTSAIGRDTPSYVYISVACIIAGVVLNLLGFFNDEEQ